MEVAELASLTMAETLTQRRTDVHVQRIRSLAENNPKAIAAVIAKWLAEDHAGQWRQLARPRPAYLFPK